MTPYLLFGLAMLAIVVVSLLVTGNMAAAFNERAKRDLREALEPLATQIDGTINIEDASARGRYHSQITSAQVIPGPGGMGRLFQTTFTEPAGGTPWTSLVRRPKTEESDWVRTFEGQTGDRMAEPIYAMLDDLLPFPGWFELTYSPDSGVLTLTRAMQSRRDLPTADRFARYLTTLDEAARLNRRVQTGTDPV